MDGAFSFHDKMPGADRTSMILTSKLDMHQVLRMRYSNWSNTNKLFNGNFRILKWRYCTICLAIFCGDIHLHRPYIGLIYGRYLHFRILKLPLMISKKHQETHLDGTIQGDVGELGIGAHEAQGLSGNQFLPRSGL